MAKVSRREMLKALGVGAAGVTTFGLTRRSSVSAQTTPVVGALASVYQFQLGDWDMHVIKDAAFTPAATIFGSNQEEADVLELFDAAHVLQDDNTINALVDIMVAQTGDDVILFDTGFGPGGGALVPTLEALGITPADVTVVVSSHFHPDHINGLSNDDGLVYPNAQVFFSQPEYDFLQNAPEDVAGAALGKLQPALDNDQVAFYGDGDEILSGISAIHSPGHTPGQMNFMLESNGNRLLHLVDTVLNVYAHVPNPTWHSQFDADGEQAVETRINHMTLAANEGIPVFGYHFPFPGIGYVDSADEGFAFTHVAF